MLYQYYSILLVILSNTHFNILLHIGEYWFEYYLPVILPEQLADAACIHASAAPELELRVTGTLALPGTDRPPGAAGRARGDAAATLSGAGLNLT